MILYWIKTKDMTDPKTQGYVGVTTRSLSVRLNEHRKSCDNPHLRQAIEKYTDMLEIIQLEVGADDVILEQERLHRPDANIGWNIAPGGGCPPNSKTWWSAEHSNNARERMAGNSYKLNYEETEETRTRKKIAYAENYESRSHAQKNKSAEWKAKAAENRKGKGKGKHNAMASAEAKEKVAASKRGRYRMYREDGSFYMSPKPQLMAGG